MNGENLREGNSPSWFNPQEAQQVVAYATMLLRETPPPLSEDEIGIIAPYARQAQKTRLALESRGIRDVKVGAVECFQGQERRCIIVTTGGSEIKHINSDLRYNLGFVANPKRFNVVVTRAKTLLIVVGSAEVLSLDKGHWLPFMECCHENGGWTGEEWNPDTAASEEFDGIIIPEPDEQYEDWVDVAEPSRSVAEEVSAFVGSEE